MTKAGGSKDDESKPDKPKRQVKAVHHSYPLDKVLELRKILKTVLAVECLNTTPTGDKFDRVVDLVRGVLPGNIDRPTLVDSLRHLAGTFVTEQVLDKVCWRMAGNYKRLKYRKAVPPWHAQRLPEWVPTQIVSCRRERKGKKIGARLGFRILAGTPAGLTAYKWWSLKFCRYLSTDFMFSKRPRGRRLAKMPYTAPEQLVGLRVNVRVMPKECGREPGFDSVGFPAASKAWNKTQLSCRFRIEPGFRCKLSLLAHQLACHHCPLGYQSCRAATHKTDWVKKDCPECKQEAFFDPEIQSDACVDCFIRSVYRGDVKS